MADDYIGAGLASLTNTGTIAAEFGLYLNSTGTLGAFTNSGVLSASNTGLRNNGGTLGTITNSGTIAGLINGLVNAGSIALVTNSGLIADNAAPSHVGLSNSGTMGALTNSGTITGQTGLANSGTLGAVTNSGTISGSIAINNSGIIGPIANTGIIAGDIVNTSANALSISGGAGSALGTLTGFAAGTQGTISTPRRMSRCRAIWCSTTRSMSAAGTGYQRRRAHTLQHHLGYRQLRPGFGQPDRTHWFGTGGQLRGKVHRRHGHRSGSFFHRQLPGRQRGRDAGRGRDGFDLYRDLRLDRRSDRSGGFGCRQRQQPGGQGRSTIMSAVRWRH